MKTKTSIILSLITLSLVNPASSLAVNSTLPVKEQLDQNRIQNQEQLEQLKQEYIQKMRDLKVTITPTKENRIQTKDQYIELKQEYKVEVKGQKQQAIDTRKGILTQARLRVIDKLYQNFSDSLKKRYEYLLETRQKIQEKLQKRAQEGKDITSSTAKINQAIALEPTFKTDMEALDAQYKVAINSDNPFKYISELRQAVDKVNDTLKQIRSLQVQTLSSVINN